MKIMTKEEFFNFIDGLNHYSMLDRMVSDCKYVINMCECSPKAFHFLWASGGPKAQIAYMRYLWEDMDEKPEWTSLEAIDEYERKLITDNPRYSEWKEEG